MRLCEFWKIDVCTKSVVVLYLHDNGATALYLHDDGVIVFYLYDDGEGDAGGVGDGGNDKSKRISLTLSIK